MCEASREYKYKRQAFHQKARAMTEKCARAGTRGNESGSESLHSQSNASTLLQVEAKGSDALKNDKKLCGINRKLSLECLRRKLSLESLGSPQTICNDSKENLVPRHRSSSLNSQNIAMASKKSLSVQQDNNRDKKQSHQDSNSVNDSMSSSLKKVSWVGQKLSLETLKSGQISDNADEKLHAVPQLSPSLANISHGILALHKAIIQTDQQSQKDSTNSIRDSFSSAKRKKVGLVKKLSLGLLGSSQGVAQTVEHSSEMAGNCSEKVAKAQHVAPNCKLDKQQQPMEDHDEEFAGGTKQQIEGSPLFEAVIVLDSEDSEEESRGSSNCYLHGNTFQTSGKEKLES
ncbi:ubiquitin-conjugating enzyme 37 [Actinidia rufa]|uniref:Ubiquitin-conjugating enzyme 37 n=1 Tax=Actinidia rufa TaxID=165716 RepID=A0A7J0FCA9_9ERIC|nr:ubiquitin-conjugating enzyme 37 [Actinidia rufa]